MFVSSQATSQMKTLAEISALTIRVQRSPADFQRLGQLTLAFLKDSFGGAWGMYIKHENHLTWCSWFPREEELPLSIDLSTATLPLTDGTGHYGALSSFPSPSSSFSPANIPELLLLCNLLTLVLRQRAAENSPLIQKFFTNLFLGEKDLPRLSLQASLLGCDLSGPHSVVRMEFDAIPFDLIEQFSSTLQTAFPHSLLSVSASAGEQKSLTALVALGKRGDLVPFLEEQFHQLRNTQRTGGLYIGVSESVSLPLENFQRAYTQAELAMLVAFTNHRKVRGGIIHHADMGIYSLYEFIPGFSLLDHNEFPFQREFEQIQHHDDQKAQKRKGGELLDTLQTFLECGGNCALTATKLGKQDQTILDRLSKISEFLSSPYKAVNVKENRHLWPLLTISLARYRLGQAAMRRNKE